jgi:hypothetical protein
MGLLDWLSDSLGTAGSTGAAMNPTDAGSSLPQQFPSGTPPTPPVQPIASPPTVPDPATTDISGGMPPGATGAAPPPMPMPRPTGAPPPPPPAPGPPMPITPPSPPGGDIAAAAQRNMPPPPDSGNGVGIIGRALGLDPNTAKQVSGALGAGLKSVGTNWNKPGLAAFSGSAGSAIEGSNTAQDKTVDQQSKYLTQAIAASKAGDERSANQALTKLRLAQAEQTMQGKGKDGTANSDQQLYLRAQSATNQDLNLKAAKTVADRAAAEFGADSPQAKAAQDALKKASDETLNGHLTRLGLDPKKAAQIGKMPGFAQDNPIPKEKMNSQKAFDDLPPGSWFTNPKDGRVLQKPLAPQSPAGAAPAAAAAPNGAMPPLPPPTPSANTDAATAGTPTTPVKAADDDDED